MDWRHKAACLDEDPELFFPIGNTGPALLQIEEAKQVCRRCDVRDACLQWALEAGQDHGVWGGLSEDERRALKRRAARASAPHSHGFVQQAKNAGKSPAFLHLHRKSLHYDGWPAPPTTGARGLTLGTRDGSMHAGDEGGESGGPAVRVQVTPDQF